MVVGVRLENRSPIEWLLACLPRLLDRPPKNDQLVAKEKGPNFAVAIIDQPENEQTNKKTQAAVEASKDHGRPA